MGLSNIVLLSVNPLIPVTSRSTYCLNGEVMRKWVLAVDKFWCPRRHPFGSSHRFSFPISKSLQQASLLKRPSICHVQSEDTGESVIGESVLADQQALEQELQMAVEEENYALAAKIRDSIKNLHKDSKALLLAANARFYNAFRTGDLAGMQALWAPGDHVCCVHPGVPVISGHDLVMQSWEYVLADYEFPLKIELKDILVHGRGDLGYVTCVEFIKTTGSSWGRQTATNVFEKINGQWFICIHHATRIVT